MRRWLRARRTRLQLGTRGLLMDIFMITYLVVTVIALVTFVIGDR
jgi:hypothetical protein